MEIHMMFKHPLTSLWIADQHIPNELNSDKFPPMPREHWSASSSSSFFFSFPSYISGVHHFGWDFCVCDRVYFFFFFFLNPTIEVVTFRLRGWCMLGVLLLPAFTRLGHECQDLLSPCDGMHVCTHYTSVYIFIRKSFFMEWSQNPC